MAARLKIEGLFSVTVTPFDAEGALDLGAFATILRWHIAQGSAGLAIAADNGEASLLTLTERQGMAETAVRVADGRVPVVMGTMGTHAFTAADTIKMGEIAAAAGVDALLVSPAPYNGQATRAELVGRFRAIHRAVPLPIVAYNNPRHFGVGIEGDTLQHLMDEVDVVAVKQSSRDFREVSYAIERFGERVSMMIGCAWFIMPGLSLGGAGVLSTGVDLLGGGSARLLGLARGPACPERTRLHLAMSRAYSFLLETGSAPSALKALLGMIGLPAGQPRLPVLPLDGENAARLRALFIELGVLDAGRAALPGE